MLAPRIKSDSSIGLDSGVRPRQTIEEAVLLPDPNKERLKLAFSSQDM